LEGLNLTKDKTGVARKRGFDLSVIALFCLVSPALCDSFRTFERSVTKLSEGVYAIRHQDPPNAFVQGNTLVVIGDREVLVVDSAFLPSSARDDIAQIRQWTSKPLRYLLNIHWHVDHWGGNAEYRAAFPGLVVIGQVETTKRIAAVDPPSLVRNFRARADRAAKRLAAGKKENGDPLTATDIANLNARVHGNDVVIAELEKLRDHASGLIPFVSSDHDLNLDLGNRRVEIKFLGRGNTAGDAIAYLPQEQIVATGDLLDHPVPYLGGGFPDEQIETLQRIAAMEIRTIVPGHGDTLNDQVFLNMTIDCIQEIVSNVDKLLYDPRVSADPEVMEKAVRQRIDVAAWRQKFAGSDPYSQDFFDNFSLPGVIEAAYDKLSGR
jgi:cyclase